MRHAGLGAAPRIAGVLDIAAPIKLATMLNNARACAADVARHAASADDCAQIPESTWRVFRSSGMGTSALPTEFGGCDLWDPQYGGELCTMLRLIGAADLSLARLFEGHVNAISLVCRYGTQQQIADLAHDVADGALSGVWGAEDARGLKLVSVNDGTLTLEGRKILASGAGFVTRPLVTANGPDGQQLCLLRLKPGYDYDISGWQAQGMRATATGTVDFTGTTITANEQVGRPGDYMQQPTFSGGAWRFCAVHLGGIERLVDLFRQHLVASKRGEDPYQLERLAACVAAAKTARFWVEDAARRFGSDSAAAGTVAFTHLTRMAVERSALTVIETVQRGVGLRAFVRPNDIERICRDLSTYLRQPAPDLAMSDAARTFLHASAGVGEF
ncbi:MAG: acyl-CoA dehydrogenase family protein [Hyphomicrobiales bacterium]|nr:acyl-CoA dehydrogenase family protein [Hyphomicrobiales bacterium]